MEEIKRKTIEEEKKDIVEAVKNGKAYAYVEHVGFRYRHDEDMYVFPNNCKTIPIVEKKMLTLCNNATVYVGKETIWVENKLVCYNHFMRSHPEPVSCAFIILNRQKIAIKELCEHCKNMVRELVGECNEQSFSLINGEASIEFQLLPEADNYLRIKPGYIRPREFSNEVDFSLANVKDRVEYFEQKGKWRRQINKTRKEICADCIKYKTKTCDKGFRGHNKPTKCHYTKEQLMERLRRECIADFGSMPRAFWYFSQCGELISYKDPISKRRSARYIAVPGNPEGKMEAKGFFMSLRNYPYHIGDYGYRENSYRWRSINEKDKTKKHENYMSEKQYKQEFKDIEKKIRYKKKFEEAVLTAYAIYRHVCATPGNSCSFGYGRTDLIYFGMDNTQNIEVGVGMSKWQSSKTVKDLRELFNETYCGIEKR